MNTLTVQDVLRYAASGELKNLSVVNNYDDMCNFINLMLIELHGRFVLNQRIIDIPLSEDKTTYNLQEYL